MTLSDERARILAEYRRRGRDIPADFYALHRPANLFIRHGQERALRSALARAGVLPLAGRRILDVGCGEGQWLAVFEDFGADRAALAAIDLDDGRAAACAARYPGADVRAGDAAGLPWPDGDFDLVFQSTVFTSILDVEMQRRVAAEMLRVLRPGGLIAWYDFAYDNPRNPNVRGLPGRAIRRLFPACRVELDRVTLAPPVARRLVPLSWLGAAVLERLVVFNTHYLGVIRK